MKISTLIWLKSQYGQTNPVYSSLTYAIEFDDTIWYEHSGATNIDKRRMASYSSVDLREGTDAEIAVWKINKKRSAAYVGTSYKEEFDHRSVAIGIFKKWNQSYVQEESYDPTIAVIGITKRLDGHYINRTLQAEEIHTSTAVMSVIKARKVKWHEQPADEQQFATTITGIRKHLAFLEGGVESENIDHANAVEFITKDRKRYGIVSLMHFSSKEESAEVVSLMHFQPAGIGGLLNFTDFGYEPPDGNNVGLNFKR